MCWWGTCKAGPNSGHNARAQPQKSPKKHPKNMQFLDCSRTLGALELVLPLLCPDRETGETGRRGDGETPPRLTPWLSCHADIDETSSEKSEKSGWLLLRRFLHCTRQGTHWRRTSIGASSTGLSNAATATSPRGGCSRPSLWAAAARSPIARSQPIQMPGSARCTSSPVR